MSNQNVRKVIPIKSEPASALRSADKAAVMGVCAEFKKVPGPLMPVLHAVQRKFGYVPEDAVPLIAKELNLSIAEVHGVVTFYHYFLREKPGKHVVHICRAEACQALGAQALEAHAKSALHIDFHQTTADGRITLEPVYCLGNCALGPSIMIDEQLKGRVTPQRFDALLATLPRD
jgi:formate dehydrogenase subunit gamma